jgi:hypothetical protein
MLSSEVLDAGGVGTAISVLVLIFPFGKRELLSVSIMHRQNHQIFLK